MLSDGVDAREIVGGPDSNSSLLRDLLLTLRRGIACVAATDVGSRWGIVVSYSVMTILGAV
jgi:hypothetical protein